MNQAPSSFYGSDLAYIHDAGHGQFAHQGAGVLLEQLRRTGKRTGLVVHLGCGGGIEAERLCKAGYEVLGSDISEDMIALARERVPHGQFRVEPCLSASLPPCIAVTAIGECFNYLTDPAHSDRALVQLFRRIHDALVPGGLFLFDVAGPGRARGRGAQRMFREEDDWAVLVIWEEDTKKRLMTRRITSFRKVGKLYRRAIEVHRLRLFERSELAEVLRGAGFRVRPLGGYGTLRFRAGHFGFLARKP
jgi:SAM-dependent methyltransferase